ncbi:MAG: PepSY domain-containing protein [Methyloceanibacter sp.]|nr:PepSY domain-containing protein [Methyloceanibacter sp.]
MRVIPLFLAMSLALAVPAAAEPLSIDDVRALAFEKGIVKIEEVELDDGIWEVEGHDSSGHQIEMKVEAASGNIIKLERDD